MISHWITLPTQSYLVLYSFCTNLLHSLIMILIVSSLSPYSVHLLFCYVLSILALIWLVLTVLSCAAIRRDSVSLLKFPFLSHVQLFSCEMLLISRLNHPQCCFPLHFCFLVIVILLSIVLLCCILTFDPAKDAIPKWCTGRKWHIPMASNRKRLHGRIWLMKWNKVKIPWYTHRLMHRKRVTLTAWLLFPLDDDQTYHSKDWEGDWVGVDLLYNSVKTGSQTVRDRTELETSCGRESHTRPKGPSGPPTELKVRVGVQRSCW